MEIIEHLHLPRLGREAHLPAALILIGFLCGLSKVVGIQLDARQGLRAIGFLLCYVIHSEA